MLQNGGANLYMNTPVEKDDIIHENYLRSSKFRSSSADGFMQNVVYISTLFNMHYNIYSNIYTIKDSIFNDCKNNSTYRFNCCYYGWIYC